MPGPRYDRIVPLVTMILVGLGIAFILDAGPARPVIVLGAGLPSLGVSWLILAVIALVAGLGTEFVIRGHPRFTHRWLTPVRLGRGATAELLLPFWTLPALTPVAIFAFFRLFGGALASGAYLLVLLISGALLLIIFAAQHRLLTLPRDAAAPARNVLAAVAYLLLFAICAAVEFNRYRTLFAAILLFPSALLLGYDLLRLRLERPWPVAASIALGIVQAYWALAYWPAPFLLVGAALLVIFYTAVGLAQSSTEGGISRAALREYGLLAAGALLALAIAATVLQSRLDRLME